MTVPVADRVTAASHPCRLRLFPREVAEAPVLWFLMLTYNALPYTRRCLLSLDRTTTVPWRALILDNGSTDGTREWLGALRDPRIEVSFAERNLGVAGGRNRQLALLDGRVPDDALLVFVDNDLEFFGDWSAPFLARFAAEPTLGIASAAGYEIVVHGDRRDLLPSFCAHPQMVDVAAGGFACTIRPGVFRAIGGFDEALSPFWHEDDDLSVRARTAGWDVLAIPSPGIIHHGHKSGSALPDLSRGGSREKQRYLVDKWRAAGVVAEEGRLQFTREGVETERRTRLGVRMRRRGALRLSEFSRALVDVRGLQRAYAAHGSIRGAEVFASAPARAVLEDAAQVPLDDLPVGTAQALAAQITQLVAQRRRLVRLPADDATSYDSMQADAHFADVRAWEDDRWFARVAELAGDAGGRQQWYARSLATWRAGHAATALEDALGPLGTAHRVLVVGPVSERLIWGLAARGVHLVVADLPPHEATAGTDTPTRHAWREVPEHTVTRVAVDSAARTLPSQSFDALIQFPWTDPLPPEALGELLASLRDLLRADAPRIATLPVRLAGPPAGALLDGARALPRWLGQFGLRLRHDRIDERLSDETLLSVDDPAIVTPGAWRATDLLTVNGPRLTGHLGFVAVAASDRAMAVAT